MKIFGFDIGWSKAQGTTLSINQVIERLDAASRLASGVSVTPDTAMQSPTVQAIVQAVSRRIASLPIRVYEEDRTGAKITRKELPDHSVAKLMRRPNDVSDAVTFWLDATSNLIRWGNVYFIKRQGATGPIRSLQPFGPAGVDVRAEGEDGQSLIYKKNQEEFPASRVMHARGPARNGFRGDSPVMDVREAIGLEIAAERMGSSVFGNNAAPGIVFKFVEGFAGFKSAEERDKFVEEFQSRYSRATDRFRAMVLPKGMDMADPIAIEAEKAQFLQTRQFQRSVIAGAFGIPPHLVGDLTRGTYNNVEHQGIDFINAVVLPHCRIFEAAMERSLLSDEDRRAGVIIRFDLAAAMRGDFKTHQEGLNLQRMAGVINANEWRQAIGMNPIPGEDGNVYYTQGPSGQNAGGTNTPPAGKPKPEDNEEPQDENGNDPV